MAVHLTPEQLHDMRRAGSSLLELGRSLLEAERCLLSTPACGAAPASKWAIEALKDVAGEGCQGDDQHECAICLLGEDQNKAARWKEMFLGKKGWKEMFLGKKRWKEMPCGHSFHGGCLEKWLNVIDTCPMCRRSLSPPAPEITPAVLMDLKYRWLVAVQKLTEVADEWFP